MHGIQNDAKREQGRYPAIDGKSHYRKKEEKQSHTHKKRVRSEKVKDKTRKKKRKEGTLLPACYPLQTGISTWRAAKKN